MKCPTSIWSFDWPDTELVPEGYDLVQQPKLSEANFLYLIEQYNQLAEVVYELTVEYNERNNED
jgi:hypothetical protein